MSTTMSVSQARAALPEVLDRVIAGEEITITRHGTPVAVVVRPEVLRARRADAALAEARRIHDLIEDARHRRSSPGAGISAERAEELVAALYADRARD